MSDLIALATGESSRAQGTLGPAQRLAVIVGAVCAQWIVSTLIYRRRLCRSASGSALQNL